MMDYRLLRRLKARQLLVIELGAGRRGGGVSRRVYYSALLSGVSVIL